jgi:ABC-2 type transport system permease protein
MHYLAVLRVLFGVNLLNELQYRVNFAVQLVQSAISLGTALLGLAVIFSHTRTLGGWSPEELVVLLGIYSIMAGFMGAVIGPSLSRLMQDVRDGTLDFTLTKPVASQFLVSFRQIVIWRLADVLLGGALVFGGTVQLGERIGVLQAASFAVTLVAAAVIVYSFRLVLATLTFWIIRVENIMVIWSSLFEAGRYPVGLYPEWLRMVLTLVVPVAFATTVPAEALAGRLNPAVLAAALALAALSLWAASAFWRFGLRHYTGASA